MTPITHTKGLVTLKWRANGGASLCANDGHERIGTVNVRYSVTNNLSEVQANASLLARFHEVPHTCTDPACPGMVNQRKLEAFEGLLEAAKRAFDSAHIDADDLDIALNALSWIRGGLEIAIARAEGREA